MLNVSVLRFGRESSIPESVKLHKLPTTHHHIAEVGLANSLHPNSNTLDFFYYFSDKRISNEQIVIAAFGQETKSNSRNQKTTVQAYFSLDIS